MSPKSSCCEFKAFQINIEFDSASGFLFCLVFGFNYKANSSYFIHKIRNYHKNNATDDREIENKPTENKTACNFWSFLFAIKYIKLVRNKKKQLQNKNAWTYEKNASIVDVKYDVTNMPKILKVIFQWMRSLIILHSVRWVQHYFFIIFLLDTKNIKKISNEIKLYRNC